MPGRQGRSGGTPLTRAQSDMAGKVVREHFDPTKVKALIIEKMACMLCHLAAKPMQLYTHGGGCPCA